MFIICDKALAKNRHLSPRKILSYHHRLASEYSKWKLTYCNALFLCQLCQSKNLVQNCTLWFGLYGKNFQLQITWLIGGVVIGASGVAVIIVFPELLGLGAAGISAASLMSPTIRKVVLKAIDAVTPVIKMAATNLIGKVKHCFGDDYQASVAYFPSA